MGVALRLLVAGAPGLALALLAVATLDEPRRRAPKVTAPLPPFWTTIRALTGNRSFVFVACGAAALSFISYGHGAFIASFFLRNHGPELAATAAGFGLKPIGFLGLALGISSGLAGIAGAVVGGPLADRWAARDITGYAALPAICVGLTVPVLSGALLSPMWLAIPLFATAAFLNAVAFGPIFASVQGLVQPWSRATASAAMLFIINIVGLGLGPTLIGVLSDVLAARLGKGDGLRWAMIAATASGIIAMLLFNAARQTIRRDTVS